MELGTSRFHRESIEPGRTRDEPERSTTERPPIMSGQTDLAGPDLQQGIDTGTVKPGDMVLGHAGGEPVLLARVGDEFLAIGATCTHYGGPLANGVIVGDTVRCPWHHACFSLRTGDAVRAPALNPVAAWRVERRGSRVVVSAKREHEALAAESPFAVGATTR